MEVLLAGLLDLAAADTDKVPRGWHQALIVYVIHIRLYFPSTFSMGILLWTQEMRELALERSCRGSSRPLEELEAWLYDSVILDISLNYPCKTVQTNPIDSDFHLSEDWKPEL